ncbi:PAS domain-containing protein [Nocardioides zeae]
MELGDLYRQVVRSLSDGILVLDLDGTIRYANQSCADLVRMPLDDLAGRHMHDFLDADGRVHSQGFLDRAARGCSSRRRSTPCSSRPTARPCGCGSSRPASSRASGSSG